MPGTALHYACILTLFSKPKKYYYYEVLMITYDVLLLSPLFSRGN